MSSRVALLGALSLFAFISTSPLSAQQPTSSDRLTGQWTGYIGQSEGNPAEITFELARGPDGRVSGSATGPQLTPGDVHDLVYDPTTGSLRFTVVIRGSTGENGRVKFDGRVVQDTASGTIVLNGEPGVFRLVRADPTARAAAPLSPKGDPGAAVRRGLVEVSDWITRAAALVPAERYSYRPVGTVRTFGQLVGHVIDGSNYYCGRAAGRNVEWTDATERTVTTKEALAQALARALADCRAVYDGAGEIAPMMENLVHTGLHYGNMVTYMRMMGLTPPSS